MAGASFAGLSVALNAARAGYKVALIESRTYPGYEVSALVRPWISAQAVKNPPSSIAPWIREAAAKPAGPGELAIVPDEMKRRIETELLAAGVSIYYGSQPVGVVRQGRRIAGLVMADKSGRQAVLARCVVDATPWGDLARLAGDAVRHLAAERCIARRTLEFTNVSGRVPAALTVPDRLKAGKKLKVRKGALGAGHYLLEAAIPLAALPADYRSLLEAEMAARAITVEIVKHLFESEPAFRNAAYGQASWELALPSPWIARNAQPGLARLEPHLDPLASARAGDSAWPRIGAALAESPRPSIEGLAAECGRKASRSPGRLQLKEQFGRTEGLSPLGVSVRPESVPVLAEADVVVAGGGTAGPVTSAVAARNGASACLLEMHSGLGGTGTLGGINVYWMGWRQGFTAEVDARVAEQDRDLRTAPRGYAHGGYLSYWGVEAKMHALLKWNLENGVDVLFRAQAVGTLAEGNAVKGVLVATPDGLAAVLGKVTVDATGDGDVAAWAGAEYAFGSARDQIPMWTHVPPIPKPGFPNNAHTTAADVTDVRDATRTLIMNRRRSPAYDHGVYVAPRESRLIKGDAAVTLTDNLVLREFPDAVTVFVSNPDVKGMSDSKWFSFGIQTPHCYLELPYRALLPAGLEGIIIGGKSFSASHDAISAMRMQPDMQNMGGAVGLAAAQAVKRGVPPRRVDVPALQRELVRVGAIPAVFANRRVKSRIPKGKDLRRLIAGLKGDEPLYYEQLESCITLDPLATALICAANPREAVPALARAHAGAKGARRLLLARLLAWHGSRAGSATLLSEARRELGRSGVPRRRRYIRNTCNIIPDQGAYPELCILLHTLGMSGERKVMPILQEIVRRLDTSYESFRDVWRGTFYYAEAVCCLAERLADPKLVPLLEKLHAKPGLHGLARPQTHDPDTLAERIVYLELAIGRAMARCGSPRGARILIDYLDDGRAYYSRHAHRELVAIAGRDFGRGKRAWLEWLDRKGGRLTPRPWTEYAY